MQETESWRTGHEVETTHDEELVATGVRTYRRGLDFRRLAEAQLKRLGLSFPRWWVLDTTDRLVREYFHAVSQADVARRTGLDANTIGYVMRGLEKRALVSRQPGESGLAYAIYVTPRGRSLVARARRAIVRVL